MTDRVASQGVDPAVSADAELPALDDRSLVALREVGRQWADDAPRTRASLPVDPELSYGLTDGPRQGRFVEVHTSSADEDDELEATAMARVPDSALGQLEYRIRRALVGPPLRSSAVAEERMGKLLALPLLSPDALSSVAYGPQAMLAILALAGSAELKLSLPIAAVLVVLMISVGLGYRQVIRAYPHGGGSYAVAADNLGPKGGLLAGAGLIVDYILTVAVSVAAGVAAITSALPALRGTTVPLGLAVIALLAFGNLRGVRTAGALFAAPTYLFLAAVALIVTVGLVNSGAHGFHAVPPAPRPPVETVGVLLILRAFASGATAMTGIEVISNAVPVFRAPAADNARRSLSIMVALLATMFVGVVLVAHLEGAGPGGQTLLSQLAHRTVGGGVLYGYVQVATTLVLLVAANSAVSGFPRLLYFMARDGYAPRALLHLGDRLAFSAGIIVLAAAAGAVFAALQGRTASLIPLYAVGVFVAFTLAQAAMVVHWRRHREPGWRQGLAINLVGAVLSGAVALTAAVTKFTAGAWIVVILIPLIALFCSRVHRHYAHARQALTPQLGQPLAAAGAPPGMPAHAATADDSAERQDVPAEIAHLVVVPVATLDLAGLRALAYAASLAVPVLALHVCPSPQEDERFRRYWQVWGEHLPLQVILSPYRATLAPLAHYIEALHHQRRDITLTVVVPEVIPARRWQRLLHHRTAARLRRALIRDPGIIITSVPFHLPR